VRALVTGAGGQLGSTVGPAIRRSPAGHEVIEVDHSTLDIGDRDAVDAVVSDVVPDVIVNAAAMTDVDGCERDPDAAYRCNALALRHMGTAADRIGAHVVHVSTDFVFSGDADRPYTEWDATDPASVYARSKLAGEHELAASCRSWAVARTSWVFGRPGGDFISWVLDTARRGELRGVVDDETGSPTLAADLAGMLVRLAVEQRRGLFHVTNQGSCTRLELAREILDIAGMEEGTAAGVAPSAIRSADLGRPAARPHYSVLDNAVLRLQGVELLRHWKHALADYLQTSGLLAVAGSDPGGTTREAEVAP